MHILPGSMAAIDPEIAASHEAARIAEQEHSRATKFSRQADAAQHVFLGPDILSLGAVIEKVLQHLREDVTGRYGVDTDPVLSPF